MLNHIYLFFSSSGLRSGSAVLQKSQLTCKKSVVAAKRHVPVVKGLNFGIGELAIKALSGLNGHFNGPSTKAITI